MAVNSTRAFKEVGWCTRIRGVQSGGEVINLPTHTFPTDDGGVDLKCPTEIAISDRREHELAKAGLIPLIHRKTTDKAAFIGAQSLYKPKKYFGEQGVDGARGLLVRSEAACRADSVGKRGRGIWVASWSTASHPGWASRGGWLWQKLNSSPCGRDRVSVARS